MNLFENQDPFYIIAKRMQRGTNQSINGDCNDT